LLHPDDAALMGGIVVISFRRAAFEFSSATAHARFDGHSVRQPPFISASGLGR
jgi:hypothetical protein